MDNRSANSEGLQSHLYLHVSDEIHNREEHGAIRHLLSDSDYCVWLRDTTAIPAAVRGDGVGLGIRKRCVSLLFQQRPLRCPGTGDHDRRDGHGSQTHPERRIHV